MSLQLINIIIVFFIVTACNSSSKQKITVKEFDHLVSKKKTVIISCIKCQCIIDELNNYATKNKIDNNEIMIYGDTTCLKTLSKNIPINHLPQSYIDSCSTEFYNVLIITKHANVLEHKIVTTKEAVNLSEYLKK